MMHPSVTQDHPWPLNEWAIFQTFYPCGHRNSGSFGRPSSVHNDCDTCGKLYCNYCNYVEHRCHFCGGWSPHGGVNPCGCYEHERKLDAGYAWCGPCRVYIAPGVGTWAAHIFDYPTGRHGIIMREQYRKYPSLPLSHALEVS